MVSDIRKTVTEVIAEVAGGNNVRTESDNTIWVTLDPESFQRFNERVDELGYSTIVERRVVSRWSGKTRYRLNVIGGRIGSDREFLKVGVSIPPGYTEDTKPSEYPRPGHVYFLKDFLVTGWTKIGMSANYKSRVAWLTSDTPFEWAKLIHVVEAKDVVLLEQLFHIRYKKFRRHGEWFELTAEQLEFIKLIKKQEDLE